MAYTPKTWVTGETIQAADLNHAEQGIADADQAATAAQETAEEAEAMIAGEYLTTKNYKAGEYCIHAGVLYRFTEEKTAGAWDSTKVVAVALADDVSELKSAFNAASISEYMFGNDIIHVNISPSTGKWAAASAYDMHYFEVPANASIMRIKANAANGTVYALLSANDNHVIGTIPSYAAGCTRTFIPAGNDVYVAIPSDCKFVWVTKTLSSGILEPEYIGFAFNLNEEVNSLAIWKTNVEKYLPYNLFDGDLTSGVIRVSDGAALSKTTVGLKTGYVDISAYSSITYSRIVATLTSASWGMTFYDENKTHIADTGEGPVLNGSAFGFTMSEIAVPSGAKYARFTWNTTLNADDFVIFASAQYNKTIVAEVERLKAYHPNYSGKKLSILGDSISTFAASDEKTDGKAAEGCTTNYPGNPVQYSNSDVTSVSDTWWGRVLNQFGMVLGINESWAGSTIGYNPDQTSGGKYTADNCLCSENRIGHLGENGTPDIIIVFGGTNDINHHKISSGSTIRYAVGELDSANNPYDFDNFPMVTDTYYGSITTMLLRIQHSYPNATILMLLPYFCTYTHTSSGDRATPYDQNEWSKAAIEVCNYLGVEYLDLRTIINLYDVSSLLFDGLHPKANGMAAIAKAVIHKLNSML